MGSLFSKHNTKLLLEDKLQQVQGCKCTGGLTTCPLPAPECQKESVIYVASVTTNNNTEHYTGITGGTFKKRWDKHRSTFKHAKERNSSS